MGIGLWIGRTVRSSTDFFVAGRRLGPSLLFSTMLAANIGAGSTVAAAGLGYANGLSAWWWVGSAGLGIDRCWPFGSARASGASPRNSNCARSATTSSTASGSRCGRPSPSCCGWERCASWPPRSSVSAGSSTSSSDSPPWLGCLIGGGVVIVYFTAGGLLTRRLGQRGATRRAAGRIRRGAAAGGHGERRLGHHLRSDPHRRCLLETSGRAAARAGSIWRCWAPAFHHLAGAAAEGVRSA